MYSVEVRPGEAYPGMEVYVGELVVTNASACQFVFDSDSVHANNVLVVGGHTIEGPENGTVSATIDLEPGSYPMVYKLGPHSVGERPVGASVDITVTCETTVVETTTTTEQETTTTTEATTTTTSEETTTTTSSETTTTTTGGESSTTTLFPPTSIVSSTTVPPVTESTLPLTGGGELFGTALLAIVLIAAGIWMLIQSHLKENQNNV